jgi:hypothetical protein
VLVAICIACQKTIPTASMISFAGRENGKSSTFQFAYRAQLRAGDRQDSAEFINHATSNASLRMPVRPTIGLLRYQERWTMICALVAAHPAPRLNQVNPIGRGFTILCACRPVQVFPCCWPVLAL